MTRTKPLASHRAPRSFAVATILFRDAFGYMPGGLLLLLLIEWRWAFFSGSASSTTLSEWPGEGLMIMLLVLLAYPVGRLAYNIGGLIQWDWGRERRLQGREGLATRFRNPLGWDRVHDQVYRCYDQPLSLSEMKPFGIPPTPDESTEADRTSRQDARRLVFHELATRWVFLQRPDLYFVSMTRINTLRILADTTLGVVLLAGLILYLPGGGGGFSPDLLHTILYLSLVGASLAIANRLRKEQSRAELLAAYVTYAHLLPKPPVCDRKGDDR